MSEISEPSDSPNIKPDSSIIRRLLIFMAVLLSASVVWSLLYATWRETAGLIVGGALGYVNMYWLKASLGKTLNAAATGRGESTALWLMKYNLRFMSLILIVMGIYLTGLVSLEATFAGMLSLAMAILLEGFLQLFLAVFFKREEI